MGNSQTEQPTVPTAVREDATQSAPDQDQLSDIIQSRDIDFLDFGCSRGGSMDFATKRLGGTRGLGVDIDPRKVEAAREAGRDAVVADVTQLDVESKAVDFVVAMHFLEHLPSFKDAKRAIGTAIKAARRFVYIRHPWFDSDSQLFRLGYKFYWSDWSGHTCHFDSLSFYRSLGRNPLVKQWTLMGRGPVHDTQDPALQPLQSATNSHQASPTEVAARSAEPVPQPCFREIACLVELEDGQYEQLEPRLRLTGHITLNRSSDYRFMGQR